MSVIAIETAMQHVYAEPEDQNMVQLYLDAAEDQAEAERQDDENQIPVFPGE